MTVGTYDNLKTYDWPENDGIDRACAHCGERISSGDVCVQWLALFRTVDIGEGADSLYWHARCANTFALKFTSDAMAARAIELGLSYENIHARPHVVDGPLVVDYPIYQEESVAPAPTSGTENLYTLDQLRKAWGAGVHAAKEGRV